MFTDTHCHLFKEYYDDLDSLLLKIRNSGVEKVISNGCDRQSNEEVLDSIKKFPMVYGAIGIHPEDVLTYKEEDISFIEKHINDSKVLAVGEIGLDYHYGKETRDKQIELFERQLKLAQEVDKPVIIHSRDATEDTIMILKKYHVRGIMHSFSGSYETACIYIKMGFLLGINGVVTFKNCNLKDVLAKIDLKNIVLETDAPYLTPVPYRGEVNDSSHIIDIAKYICQLKGISMNDLAMVTNDNINRVFDK